MCSIFLANTGSIAFVFLSVSAKSTKKITNPERRNSKKKLLVEGKHKRKKWRPLELEDQPWFPNFLRRYQMAYLSTVDRIVDLYEPAQDLIAKIEPETLVDLATGSGESVSNASKKINTPRFQLIFTDKFPAGESNEKEILELDVLKDEYPHADLYTIFNAFHHFNEEQRLHIASIATQNGKKLLVIEPLQPTLLTFSKVLIATSIGPILLTPFMRPFSWKWIAITYLIPIGILVTVWDGLASVIKSLGKDEWMHLENEMIQRGRTVEQGFLSSRTTTLKYFLVS